MTAAFIYTAGILSGIPVGFILAAWALHRERVKVEPEDEVHFS